MSPVGIIKFIGAWVCVILAVGFLVVGHQLPVMTEVMCALAIAFSLAPSSWA